MRGAGPLSPERMSTFRHMVVLLTATGPDSLPICLMAHF
jgi:hypothetical protein